MENALIKLDNVHRLHRLTKCDISPSGEYVVLGDSRGWVSSYNLTGPELQLNVGTDETSPITGIGIDAVDLSFYSAAQDGTVFHKRLPGGGVSFPVNDPVDLKGPGGPSALNVMALSPDRKKMAFCLGGRVYVWDGLGASLPQEVGRGSLTILNLSWHPDSKHLITSDGRWDCIMWDTSSRTEIRRYRGPKWGAISDIDVSPDGQKLLVTYGGNYPREFDLDIENHIRQIDPVQYRVLAARYGAEGNSLALSVLGRQQGAFLVTDLSFNIRSELTHRNNPIEDFAFARGGELILVAGGDGVGYIYDYQQLRRGT